MGVMTATLAQPILATSGAGYAAMPEPAEFVALLAPAGNARSLKGVRRLHALIGSMRAGAEVYDNERSVARLGQWLRGGGGVPLSPYAPTGAPAEVQRLWLLLAAIEAFPAIRARMCELVRSVVGQETARGLFANMGIPGDRGLLAETIDRLAMRLLPQPLDAHDLVTGFVARLFPHKDDPDWLADVPSQLAERLVRALRWPIDEAWSAPPEDSPAGGVAIGRVSMLPRSRRNSIWLPLRAAVLDAVLLLASRVSAAGLSDAIRARSPAGKLRDSPFFRLPRSIDALLATGRDRHDELDALTGECRELVGRCRDASKAVLERLEQAGVSVDVVYRLELIERSLARIELLLGLCVPLPDEELGRRATVALVVLLRERRRDLSLIDIVRTNTRLLARKVIERAGSSGEHYITVSKREYLIMLASAAGGGVLTAGTTALKFFIGWLHRPPLQEGLLASANYAGSFMMMQLLGFTLATKQPSMTAAALAGAMKASDPETRGGSEALVTTVARLVRSQLAAALGNVLMVVPSAVALNAWWRWRTGHHLLHEDYAHKTLASLHPTHSGALGFAALTGVILWLSSLCAGWLENWAVYRRLPEAIAEHRARRWIGEGACRWASRLFARNIGGVGGNVSVGVMLALTPVIGQFSGLPLDVRHVTLSTGSVTMAVCSLGAGALRTSALHAAALGIVGVLALNLTVSFTLAILLAMGARGVSFKNGARLLAAIAGGFFRRPLRFFLPVGEDAATPRPHA